MPAIIAPIQQITEAADGLLLKCRNRAPEVQAAAESKAANCLFRPGRPISEKTVQLKLLMVGRALIIILMFAVTMTPQELRIANCGLKGRCCQEGAHPFSRESLVKEDGVGGFRERKCFKPGLTLFWPTGGERTF